MRDGADEDLGAWLRLLGTPGIGRERARRLLAAFGSPQAIFSAEREARIAVAGAAAGAALDQPPTGHDALLAATRHWLADGASRGWIAIGDTRYPPQLLAAPDPPLLLYLEGQAALLSNARALAVVGSRHPTAQGRDHAQQFARELARQGWVVVSGLAMGIDGAAHEGALQAQAEGGAGTIAVMGTGPDVVYPARHRALHARLVAQGLVLSESPVGTPPLREGFPQRNRLIAGLTRGTLVVEAALQSGSLITARLASEAGREVFAIPGSILSPQSRGCHALIRQGAKLVESVADVLEEFDTGVAAMSAPLPHADLNDSDADDADPLLAALGHAPTSLDALQARTGWPTAELNARLLELELEGELARLPGGLFQRRRSV